MRILEQIITPAFIVLGLIRQSDPADFCVDALKALIDKDPNFLSCAGATAAPAPDIPLLYGQFERLLIEIKTCWRIHAAQVLDWQFYFPLPHRWRI